MRSTSGITEKTFGRSANWRALIILAAIVGGVAVLLAGGFSWRAARAATAQQSITWTHCADENATCTFTGTKRVRYGAGGTYHFANFTGRVQCSNDVFGDPVYGIVKSCGYQDQLPTPGPTPDYSNVNDILSGPEAAAIIRIAREKMAARHLKAVIVRVTIDGKEVVTEALGESMTGVPATKDMHFRNGAVAISYVATLLLQLVDEKKVSLDDKVAKWLPDIPHADRVTLGQLAQMTSGYHDYVLGNADFDKVIYENPFRQWTPRELLAFATPRPLSYEPGTNWNYAHTNYVILGLALEKITGKPVRALMRERIFRPLKLRNTADPQSPEIRRPVLHAFTSERRQALGIPPATRFYEESTYWNPSWTITHGAIQYTDIYDMTTTAEAIGTGRLLSPESHKAQIDPKLRGFGSPVEGCATCFTQTDSYTYGIGVVITGSWLMQNPLFSGYAAVEAYLPSKRIAIAVAVTFDEAAFDQAGDYKNSADEIFRAIGAYLAPDEAPPVRR